MSQGKFTKEKALYEAVRDHLANQIEEGAATAADVNNAIKLLKEVDIVSLVTESAPVAEFQDLDFPVEGDPDLEVKRG